jgi:hypothetical protein
MLVVVVVVGWLMVLLQFLQKTEERGPYLLSAHHISSCHGDFIYPVTLGPSQASRAGQKATFRRAVVLHRQARSPLFLQIVLREQFIELSIQFLISPFVDLKICKTVNFQVNKM